MSRTRPIPRSSPWQQMSNTDFAVRANGQLAVGDTADASTHYAATNTSAPGGGIYKDISGLTFVPVDTFCGSAELRNQLDQADASGQFNI